MVDPTFFKALTQLYKVVTAKHSALAVWADLDPLLYEGRELLFNRISGTHLDLQDPQLAYAGLYIAGSFVSGGEVFFPELNLKVCALPSGFILLKGRVLLHRIEHWVGS